MRWTLTVTILAVALPCAFAQADDPEAPLVLVEAEDYAEMHGLRVIERPEASGGLTVSYWEDPGSWLDLRFDLPVAGEYLISLRYALNWPDTRRIVLLDGEELGEVQFESTGSWGDFETITLPFGPVELPAGEVTVRLLNRDSRGFSLDWMALHAPEAPLADHPLSMEERADLRRQAVDAVGPGAEQLLHLGEVQFHAREAGGPAWALVAGHLLLTTGGPTDGQATVLRHETGHHQIALLQNGGRLLVAITDGATLHLVALADDAAQFSLPGPLLSAEGVRIVRARAHDEGLHLPAGEWSHETDYLEAGGLHISAAPAMIVRPWDEQGLAPEIGLQTVRCEAGHVAVARFATRWGTEHPGVGLETTDAGCVVRETAERHPTLATFYGEGMFDLRIAPDGKLTFDDLRSGETILLREGE